MVDCHTSYGKADFIEDKTSQGLWKLFIKIWVTVCCGYPYLLRIDSEPLFMAAYFRDAAQRSGVVVEDSKIEEHNAIRVGERIHALLRRVYDFARLDDPSLAL